jgi:hypothetical protein
MAAAPNSRNSAAKEFPPNERVNTMPDDKKISAPDLTKRPPRSPRQRLGGYALLPRMLDKGRAEIAGTRGEYHYNCPSTNAFSTF